MINFFNKHIENILKTNDFPQKLLNTTLSCVNKDIFNLTSEKGDNILTVNDASI